MSPVIISGMFRSGTTLLWRFLSSDVAFTQKFYEPLHGQLPREIESSELYQDYRARPDIVERWSPEFFANQLVLRQRDAYPALKQYLDQMVTNTTLIKFTRMNLRLPWLMARFPQAQIVHIVRDPRAVCFSMLKHNNHLLISPDLNWSAYHQQQYFDILSQHPKWSSWLSGFSNALPLIKVLAVWKISIEHSLDAVELSGTKVAITVRYEDLVNSPKQEMEKIYQLVGRELPSLVVDKALEKDTGEIAKHSHEKWKTGLNNQWLEEWRKVLPETTWEWAIKEVELEPLLARLGYPV